MLNLMEAYGLRDMVERYSISLEVRGGKPTGNLQAANVRRVKADGAAQELCNARDGLVEYLTAMRSPDIEGLDTILEARRDLAAWQEEFSRSFHEGGTRMRQKPEHDLEALYGKYPRAAAYLKAKAEAGREDPELRRIGEDAVLGVVFGDHTVAMQRMEAAKKAYAERHVFD